MVDNLITLFESTATNFNTNGLGSLSKATSCTVIEKRNAEYELEMTYPVDDEESGSADNELLDHSRDIITDNLGNDISIAFRPLTYEELSFNRIILAKPNPYADPQPFRIYAISKPINGIITVNAQHISYDLSGVGVSPFTAAGVVDAFVKIKNKAVGNCPFTFWTDKTSTATMRNPVPTSARSLLGGIEGSVLDLYGGEYEFDKFTVKLHNNRGSNRGVSIRYGKNLTDLTQDENCSNVYTAVYPYWYSQDENGDDVLVELDEKTVAVEGEFDYTKILSLDMTEYFEEKPTKSELKTVCQAYINAYKIGVPEVSLTVSFIPLSDDTEYKDYALLEKVNLCDTVNVEFPKLKISATSKCIATKYDVLANKYISIELGEARSDLATTVSDFNKSVSELPTKSDVEKAIENATSLITGQDGGYVVLNPPSQPQELLIMDRPVISEATRVWRWNAGGLGYSNNGYNGPYRLAMTMDGSIVADFITSGTLNANLIKAGYLTDRNNTNYWNLDTGEALFTNLKVKQSLRLIDTNGFSRVSLGYDPNMGSAIWFYDGAHSRSKMYLGLQGSANHPLISLGDDNGVQLLNIQATEIGGQIYIANPNGTSVGYFAASDNGGTFAVRNNNSVAVAGMFSTASGSGYAYTADASGNQINYMGEGGLFGNFMGKKWVRTYVYFDSLAVNRTWGNIYCSSAQKLNYTAYGITNIDNVFISLVTMDGGMWAWPVNTKQDDTYIYFVLARPTRETCQKVKVSLLIIGS